MDVLQAVGFLALVVCTAAGIGLIIGTFIKRLHGAIMTGVGASVITAAISGLFAPYEMLPPPLQLFSRVYPISSASASATYLLLGEEIVGYNPLTVSQVSLIIALSLFLLILGINLYSRLSWRMD
ncbi:MAG: ABC transporter permease [Chloroflexi bacterium]|nr:ABC transporter permease [Chloroflexota bacterium]